MTRGSALGRTARRRRLELGASQSRIAEAVGVSSTQVGRWERGEDVPDLDRARSLAAALDLDPETAENWLSEAQAQVLSIEIVEPLAPPLTVVPSDLDSDPWSTPPEKRISPPRLDREALIVRAGSTGGSKGPRGRGTRGKGNSNGNGSVSTTAVVPITADAPDPSLERLLKRQARRDERRLRREMLATQRVERAMTTAETRLRAAEQATAARRAPLPTPLPSRRSAPAPAGAANTGVVFPVPDTKRGSERVTYQGVGDAPSGNDRLVYALRIGGTVAALLLFAGLLWWAFGSLGDGFGAIVDLLRGGGEPLPDSGGVGLILPG